MKPNKDFDIEFVGLKLGLHDFEYTIENTFFQDIDFIDYLVGIEAHNLRNTGSNVLKCIIVGQRLDFDIVNYSEQARRFYRANGEKGDLVDMAVIVPRQ